MVVSLAIILPISVAIAHAMRDTWGPRLWFQIHRGANVRPQQGQLHSNTLYHARCMLQPWRASLRGDEAGAVLR